MLGINGALWVFKPLLWNRNVKMRLQTGVTRDERKGTERKRHKNVKQK